MELQPLRIGSVDYMPVYIKDRCVHDFIIGGTGTGKSIELLNMWIQDENYPVAKVMIDPAGFQAREAYSACENARYMGIGQK